EILSNQETREEYDICGSVGDNNFENMRNNPFNQYYDPTRSHNFEDIFGSDIFSDFFGKRRNDRWKKQDWEKTKENITNNATWQFLNKEINLPDLSDITKKSYERIKEISKTIIKYGSKDINSTIKKLSIGVLTAAILFSTGHYNSEKNNIPPNFTTTQNVTENYTPEKEKSSSLDETIISSITQTTKERKEKKILSTEDKIPSTREYTVKKGDSLWSITQKHLEETEQMCPTAQEIYKKTDELAQLNGKGKQSDYKQGDWTQAKTNPHCLYDSETIRMWGDQETITDTQYNTVNTPEYKKQTGEIGHVEQSGEKTQSQQTEQQETEKEKDEKDISSKINNSDYKQEKPTTNSWYEQPKQNIEIKIEKGETKKEKNEKDISSKINN
ncbi:MAG: LysM peptidoglycan-binding domain-containing protein, partial [Nanoarchaeota archaeon]|nr:LysM peptidoglycan-binding domain-containing protein [Nanoarchaeota archaeon]